MQKLSLALVVCLSLSSMPAFARCSCLGPEGPGPDFQAMARDAAKKLPSEQDRQLARNLRAKGLGTDAAPYYRSAALKAASEVDSAHADTKIGADELEQTALHSAAVHREVAAYFSVAGDAATAAQYQESAINDELLAHKINMDLATEYGAVARLYEQSKNYSKAAEIYKKQGDALATLHGRYDHDAQLAYAASTRLQTVRAR